MLSLQKFITGFLLSNFRFFCSSDLTKGKSSETEKDRRSFSLFRGGTICCSVSPLCLIFVPWCDKALNPVFSIINTAIHQSPTAVDSTDITSVLVLFDFYHILVHDVKPRGSPYVIWFLLFFFLCNNKSLFYVILQRFHKPVAQTCPLLLLFLTISEPFFEPASLSSLQSTRIILFSGSQHSSSLKPIVFISEGFSQVLLCGFVLIPWQCWHRA